MVEIHLGEQYLEIKHLALHSEHFEGVVCAIGLFNLSKIYILPSSSPDLYDFMVGLLESFSPIIHAETPCESSYPSSQILLVVKKPELVKITTT